MTADDFIVLSTRLTGFDSEELRATGMADVYESLVRKYAPAECIERLAAAAAAAGTLCLDEGPVRELARAVSHLWYLGTWPGLAATGELPGGEAFVVSSRAYAQGLVWRSFGGHAPGTVAQGFATWSTAPPGLPADGTADVAESR